MMRNCAVILIVVALVAGAVWLVGCPRFVNGGWGGHHEHHHDRD
jgi:hypothetical protein